MLIASRAIAQRNDAPKTIAEAKAIAQQQAAAEALALPAVGAKSIQDVVKISLEHDDLVVRTTLHSTENAVLQVPDLNGLAKISVARRQKGSAPIVPAHLSLQ